MLEEWEHFIVHGHTCVRNGMILTPMANLKNMSRGRNDLPDLESVTTTVNTIGTMNTIEVIGPILE